MDPKQRQASSDCRSGVLAFGDSITNGGGELQWGVALQSWAMWTARGLGLPYTSFAVDGAAVVHVLALQIPRHAAHSAIAEARYHLGTLYIGINDVRDAGWDPAIYRDGLRAALTYLSERCEVMVAVSIPTALGRPRTDPVRIEAANQIIEAEGRAAGALLLDLGDFGARNHVMADRVHPTAFGQIAIAERALALLDDAGVGLPTRVVPHTLISYRTTAVGRLRGDTTLVYRGLKAYLRRAPLRLAFAQSLR